jgi:hypothetical protein
MRELSENTKESLNKYKIFKLRISFIMLLKYMFISKTPLGIIPVEPAVQFNDFLLIFYRNQEGFLSPQTMVFLGIFSFYFLISRSFIIFKGAGSKNLCFGRLDMNRILEVDRAPAGNDQLWLKGDHHSI